MTLAHPRPIDYLAMLGLGALWGGNFLLIKIAVATIPAATFAVLRLVIAGVVVTAMAIRAGERLWFPRDKWLPIAATSLTGNALPFLLIGWGQQRVDAGIAAIGMGVMPLSAIMLAHVATHDEKLSLGKVLGVTFGLAGLIVLIGPEALTGFGREALGELAILAGAFCYGVNALLTRSLSREPLMALAAVILLLSALMDLPMAILLDSPLQLRPSIASILAVIALGAVPTGIGTVWMFSLIKRLGVSFFSQINFIVPVFGVIWGATLLGEKPPFTAFAALTLILAGVAIARQAHSRGKV